MFSQDLVHGFGKEHVGTLEAARRSRSLFELDLLCRLFRGSIALHGGSVGHSECDCCNVVLSICCVML